MSFFDIYLVKFMVHLLSLKRVPSSNVYIYMNYCNIRSADLNSTDNV